MRTTAILVLGLTAVPVAGCGDDPEPPARDASAKGADLRAELQVRGGREKLWGETARERPAGEAELRLAVANTGGGQASGLRVKLALPAGMRLMQALEHKVSPPAAGDPLDRDTFLTGRGHGVRPLPGGDETTYRFRVRVPRRGGRLRVGAVVTGEGGPVRDGATIRVRR